ncbi:hypothetical protein [Nonomuraea sp. 10N515B]|uniref:hypothetical protein n=1 Tax=Nonomuraea sp. 10N515B TaxID=3457422 RepID=UPI003FCD16E0
MEHLADALSRAYTALGFDAAAGSDEVFRQLVLARVIEPTSKQDSLRVLGEAGIDPARSISRIAPVTEVAPKARPMATSTSAWPRSWPGTKPVRVRVVDNRPRSPEHSASSRSKGAPAAPTSPNAPVLMSSDTDHADVRLSGLRRRRSALARLIFRRNPAGVVRFAFEVPFPCMDLI